jgi:predicted kinase
MDIIASIQAIEQATALREAQVRAVASLLKSLHARHIYRMEAEIQRYRSALLDVATPRIHQLAQGHAPTIQSVIERLRRIAEPFAAKAAENGYTRALMDLKSRGWLHSVRGPVHAPREIVLRIITENDSYLDGLGQDMSKGSISPAALRVRVASYSHYLWRASELAYKQCLSDFTAKRKLPHKAIESLREASSDDAIMAYFIGPDDSETCDGCSDAVNGNPYTLGDCPEPGEFECMSRCRHMVQLDGDAPDDLAPFTWSANLGFEDIDFSKLDSDEAPVAEVPAARTAAEIAELPLAALINADLTPSELADYIEANELTLDDLEGYVDPADITTIDEAMDALASALPEQDLIDALADGDVDEAIDHLNNNPDWFNFAVELGRGGLDDDVSAFALADALTGSEGGLQFDVHLGPDGKWYVVTASNAVELGLLESLREGGKGSGHHAHTGTKGIVGGSVSKFDAAVRTIFDGEVDKAREEFTPKALKPREGMLTVRAREGGSGSGNFNHAGRPGERGGAGPGTGGPHAQKEAVFMIGGSGSGKGGVIAANYDEHYHMDPDTVKKSIPLYSDKVDEQGAHGPGGPVTYDHYMEYSASERAETEKWVQEHTPYRSVQDFAATALNDHNPNGSYHSLGSGLTHELSSAVAKASLLQEIVGGKHNFVYDSTGSKNYEKWADVAQRYGYHVAFHQVFLPQRIAEERNLTRERTVPAEVLRDTHDKARSILPGLKAWASNHNVEWRYTSTE